MALLNRLQLLPHKQNLFLFGARGTGKSTLLKQQFKTNTCLWIDLLDPLQEERFAHHPEELEAIVLALPKYITHIVVDEIQKIPKLLDVIHRLIEKTSKHFIMTGSSARKLKHGGANLLAGRAFVYALFPFSYLELGEEFDLTTTLQWGLLPKIMSFKSNKEKTQFLQAYAYTYLKEEIWAEQFIKNLDPFRRFLEVAAQCNGKIINYANIAKDVGVDDKTVKNYFSILEDSLLGFFLEPFRNSFRKRLSLKPKFYFFDIGVTRSLARLLSLPAQSGTSYYGELFEQFIILECIKLVSYSNKQSEFRLRYLSTKDDAEVDLVVERPGKKLLLIEIKSSGTVRQEDLSGFLKISRDLGECEAVCFSNDVLRKKIGHVTVFPWREGIKKYFPI